LAPPAPANDQSTASVPVVLNGTVSVVQTAGVPLAPGQFGLETPANMVTVLPLNTVGTLFGVS
jgi:hypothetical protein